MYARTAAFDAAIKHGHIVTVSVDVLSNGVTVLESLPVVGGSVQVDGSAAIRRRCSLTLVDATGALTPNDPTDVLSPYGREVRIKRGIKFANGTTETLTLGTFRISSVAVNDTGADRKISIQGFDRARSISRARFETPYGIDAGKNYGDEIDKLVKSRLPGVKTRITPTTTVTPILLFDQGADPWDMARNMAESIGYELYFDPAGELVLSPAVNTALAAVAWDYSEGVGATVTAVDNTYSDEPGFNGIVVDGEPPDAPPVHWVLYDTDAASPTNSATPYGKVPRFYRSQMIATLDQAKQAAAAMLVAEKGGTEQVKFTAVPHPAHEVGDLVRVKDSRLGIDDNYVIESFDVPLDLSLMTFTTRKRRG